MEKQKNKDDGNKRRSEDVNKRGREGEIFDCLCVLKLKLIIETVKIFVLIYFGQTRL